jgi:hypothetical protein
VSSVYQNRIFPNITSGRFMNKKVVFTAQNDVKVKVNLNLLPPASHRGGAGFIPCQSMKDF